MQSGVLLFFAWLLLAQQPLALENGGTSKALPSNIAQCQTVEERPSVTSTSSVCAQSVRATSLVQRESTHGIGLIEGESGFAIPSRTREPSFGLLFIQVTLLAGLLGIVLLITNLVLRERHQHDAPKEQNWTQTHTGMGSQPRANDDFKMPSRSAANFGTPRTPPQPSAAFHNLQNLQNMHPVPDSYQPLNRAMSLPAQRQYQQQFPSSASPHAAALVPMLHLPVPKATPLPAGVNLDDCPAWAALGTHSSMDSEDGTSFITSATNSRPSTMQRLNQGQSQPGTGNIQGQFFPTPPRPVPEGVSVYSDDIDERPNASHSFPPPMAPILSGAMGSTPDSVPSDRLQAAAEETGVVLQWYPQQSIGSAGRTNESPRTETSPPGSSAWMTSRNEGPTAWINTAPASRGEIPSAWANTAPHRTRSISPVPSSHRGEARSGTPSFAPPPGEQCQEQESVAESGSMAFVPHARTMAGATLRPSQSFDPGLNRSVSKADSKGGGGGGIASWFNLATPRPGFVPSEASSMGGTPIQNIGSLSGTPARRQSSNIGAKQD